MRRMYSEQELSVIVYQVMGQYIEAGAFDQTIADYIDAYLVEHPIDPTAITGLDIAPKDVTASGNITAPSIIENMSGYSFSAGTPPTDVSYDFLYVGAVKTGNKLTLAIAVKVSSTSAITSLTSMSIGDIIIPNDVASKLYGTDIGASTDVLASNSSASFFSGGVNFKPASVVILKRSTNHVRFLAYPTADLSANTDYLLRLDVTFLLNDSLAN